MFLGTEDNPGSPHKPFTKKAKVYRRTFSKNNNSLAAIKSEAEIVPSLFLDDKIIDVTDQYVTCKDITIPVKEIDSNKYAYIGVFDNNDWVPIDWGKIKNNQVTFRKIEVGIVYAPLYFGRNGIQMANSPFILDSMGKTTFLIPEAHKLSIHKRMEINRVFPDTPDDFYVGDFDSARFQGSNDPNFNANTDLYIVPRHPLPYWNTISLNSKQAFRYIRCLPSHSMNCCLAEIAFYSGPNKLKGKIVSFNESTIKNSQTGPEMAMDDNFYTAFETHKGKVGWIRFGKTYSNR
ncbi:hypothetical protein [Chitinophaga sp. sic0106]|uniref:hypothetical protein n=1 Tax=Chitinophaga sp. sic0106 TaxID=2854785 RepID=UPI001C4584AF|nr:hypothetical protein [Chitinophaga sp. sic0106]MBV7532476.1 hypothetical protein [Chitinophaga sp. sic0106]